MAIAISLSLFVLLAGAITYVGYRHYARPSRYFDQLGTSVIASSSELSSLSHGEGLGVRVFRMIGEKVPVSPQDATLTRRMLIAAGFRSEAALAVYYGINVLCVVALVLAAFWLKSLVPDRTALRIFFVIAVGALGYFGPGLVLDMLMSRRQEILRMAMPDALDLMVVCVEAGLGLDQAILSVSRELELTHPEISDEFRLVNLEMQAGKRRAEALRNLAERTGENDIRKFVAILTQTDRFGTSMAESLRTHSDFMRVRRRQEAEERAGKVGVKLVFPIFFLILPSMLVVAAGPGLLQVFKHLLPMMKQFK